MTGRKNIVTFFTSLLLLGRIWAQLPDGYYASAQGLTGIALQQALHDIIDNHAILSYTPGLWDAVQKTDVRIDGTVWDMYSDNPFGPNPYNYIFITDQCGTYNSEEDCYNREHSFPKSWFGGEVEPMYTDLNHVFPTDGYVNSKRGNYSYGETNTPSWTSQNGSRLGPSSVTGFSGTVFEPIEEYKGDFARAHLYMAVRYYDEDGDWPGSSMTIGSQPKEWALDMLLRWHENDPVSQKEINRNDSVYTLQVNRNPFIDDPSFADKIWGITSSVYNVKNNKINLHIYPNPVIDLLTFTINDREYSEATIEIFSTTGNSVYSGKSILKSENHIDVTGLNKGTYIILVKTGNEVFSNKFVIIK